MQRVNQPDRISIDSYMDTTTSTNGYYNTFVNHAPNTALVGAKKIHLLRCTIPYIQLSGIPDYSLVFYYHKLASATQVPSDATLYAVRLYPSTYVPPTGFTAYTQNIQYTSAQDLVDQLNLAASAGGDNVTYNNLWIANDITFVYDADSGTIFWRGNDAGSFYCNAGYNDPFVRASQASDDIVTYNNDTTTTRQPYILGYTLNLRVGYTNDGINRPFGSGTNFVSPLCANLTGRSSAGLTAVYPNTLPNLNYTGNIYLYSNIVGNSGLGSVNKKNLLAVVPVDVPIGAVINYDGHSAPAYALKVASEIYSVDVEMRDDANAPFLLPDSANVNLELNILYE